MFQQLHRWAAAGLVPALFVLALAGLATPARAVTVPIITVLDSTANAGGTGSFDVTIGMPTGSKTYDLAGFQLELSVASNSGVKFTDATISTTDTYVFAGNTSTPPFVSNSTPLPGANVQVSDLYANAPGYQVLDDSHTFGLAHITYSVAAGTTPGAIAVSIEAYNSGTGGGTLLNDPSGGVINYTPTNGTITVTANAVPEPSGLVLAGTALGFGLVCLRRARARRMGKK